MRNTNIYSAGNANTVNDVGVGQNLYVGGTIINAGSRVANTWQHIAVVKYNGNTKIYVDGTQSGSTYSDSNSYTATDMDAIGYHPFAGYIDEFRITKGVARYTGNFTPRTTAWPRQ